MDCSPSSLAHHDDPLERMIPARAQIEGLIAGARDERIAASWVPVLW
jgi:PIN domain nuclease of toxin-antitoxin system